jgi:hypothetical protein
MRRSLATIGLSAGLALLANAPGLGARSNSREEDRLYNSALVLKEAMGMHSRIPRSLLEGAHLCACYPLRHQRSFRLWRKLWSRGNELPERRGWQGSMDSTVDDGS